MTERNSRRIRDDGFLERGIFILYIIYDGAQREEEPSDHTEYASHSKSVY